MILATLILVTVVHPGCALAKLPFKSYLKKPRGLGKLAHVCFQHAPHITAVKKCLYITAIISKLQIHQRSSEYQSPTILELLGSFDIPPRLQTCQVCMPRESNAEDRLLVPVRPAVHSQLGRVSVYDNLSFDWKYWFVDIIYVLIYRLGKAGKNKIRCGDYIVLTHFSELMSPRPTHQCSPLCLIGWIFWLSKLYATKKKNMIWYQKSMHIKTSYYNIITFFCNMLSVWSHRILLFHYSTCVF